MATLDEVFETVELDKEKAEAIKAEMKKAGIYVASEENLDVRYGKLKDKHAATQEELDKANQLIENAKASEKNNESLQGQIKEYEEQVKSLQEEKAKIEKESALKVALLEANAKDIDYLSYKVGQLGEIELDENGKIKNFDKTIEDLKAKHPDQFKETAKKKIDPNKLDKGDEGNKRVSKEEFKKMNYSERNKIYEEDPNLYNELVHG